jgi:DMSO/TMAO reductase YedYZ molybdopterin-dependent catalytic subunit
MVDIIESRRDAEELVHQEGRLPNGQSLTLKFPVLHYGPVPEFNAATWDFRIWGQVEEDKTWSWAGFNDLPRTQLKMDIHCVTRWSKFDTQWEGVSLGTLIDEGIINLKPEAKFVIQHAEYGYTTNLPLEIGLRESFLLATHFDGKPLEAEHGYPLRGVIGFIPGREKLKTPYFWKGAKWLRGLEFTAEDRMGFWEKAGYHNDPDIWQEERFVRD